MRQNETVDGLNFIPKHLGMKPSKGSFRWCTNKQNAPKWNRWRVEFQAQAFRNETVKGLIFLCSVLFVRCRFFVCMVEFAVFLECVSLHPRIPPPPPIGVVCFEIIYLHVFLILTGWTFTHSVTKDSTLPTQSCIGRTVTFYSGAKCTLLYLSACRNFLLDKSISFSLLFVTYLTASIFSIVRSKVEWSGLETVLTEMTPSENLIAV